MDHIKNTSPIAVVGMGGVYPKGWDLKAFWQAVAKGQTAVGPMPKRDGDPLGRLPNLPDPCPHNLGAWLGDEPPWPYPSEPPKEANLRLPILAATQAWQSTQHTRLDASRVGVITGSIALPTQRGGDVARQWLDACIEQNTDQDHTTTGLDLDTTGTPAAMVASQLKLCGPTFSTDAACASGLVALHMGIQRLQRGDLDAVLVGGGNVADPWQTQMGFASLGALSQRGMCTPLDAAGDGLLVGQGYCFVVLKRLDDAQAHGDKIWGLLAGVGVSSDTNGDLLAPCSQGQGRALAAAYAQAGWKPEHVDLVECHATGTHKGDSTEIESLRALWKDAPKDAWAAVGSAKANVGHLLTGAGLVGLTKVLWAMATQTLPPSTGIVSPIPVLGEQGPLRALSVATPWPEPHGHPRRAAVNAFGFGGINAHVLVEAYAPDAAPVSKPVSKTVSKPVSNTPLNLALVAMGGQWGNLTDLEQWAWSWLTQDAPAQGFLPQCEELRVPVGTHRLPPNEIAQMLPQQLTMLEAAHDALSAAPPTALDDKHRVGVYVGAGLDGTVFNHQMVWGQDPNRPSGSIELPVLPFNATQTLAGLAGIIASRVARVWDLGGPCMTLSAAEHSGLVAIEQAAADLQDGIIDTAVVGAVGMACDPRCRTPRRHATDLGAQGAVVFVLRPLVVAQAQNEPIVAILEGMGHSACGHSSAHLEPESKTLEQRWHQAAQTALSQAEVAASDVDLIHTAPADPALEQGWQPNLAQLADRTQLDGGTQQPQRQAPWVCSSPPKAFGRSTHADGLAGLLRAAMALQRGILPATSQHVSSDDSWPADGPNNQESFPAQAWLRDNPLGPRRALAGSIDRFGRCMQVVLRQAPNPKKSPLQGWGWQEGLFSLPQQPDAQADAAAWQALRDFAESERAWHKRWDRPHSILAAAQRWRDAQASQSQPDPTLGPARVLVAADLDDLLDKAQKSRPFAEPMQAFAKPACAWMFPASGHSSANMARPLSLHLPQIFSNRSARWALSASHTPMAELWPWSGHPEAPDPTQPGVPIAQNERDLLAQVSIGAWMVEALRDLGLTTQATIGQSLGETAALLGLDAWPGRDKLYYDLRRSKLFASILSGPRDAWQAWRTHHGQNPQEAWTCAWLAVSPDAAKRTIDGMANPNTDVFLLLKESPKACVLGGTHAAIAHIGQALGVQPVYAPALATVHCPPAHSAEEAYRQLHRRQTNIVDGVALYGGAQATPLDLGPTTSENERIDRVAEALTAQAMHTADLGRSLQTAHRDGIRLFIDMGPGRSCMRAAKTTLGHKPHHAIAMLPNPGDVQDQNLESHNFLNAIAQLMEMGFAVDLKQLLGEQSPRSLAMGRLATQVNATLLHKRLPKQAKSVAIRAVTGHGAAAPNDRGERSTAQKAVVHLSAGKTSLAQEKMPMTAPLLYGSHAAPQLASQLSPQLSPQQETPPTYLDRNACLEYARGKVGAVLGPKFAILDTYPQRVRLPDEPLMLVDRLEILEGEPCSMQSGKIRTWHRVGQTEGFLDGGRLPMGIAVEAGQADLFLATYLGMDHILKGSAKYRLLDATVTFYGPLPTPGQEVVYTICVHRFFQHGGHWFMGFSFVGEVDGQRLITMENGCAGFFTDQTLDAGEGVMVSRMDAAPTPGTLPSDWQWPRGQSAVTLNTGTLNPSALNPAQVAAIYAGDLGKAFGGAYTHLPKTVKPATLPSDPRLHLVHRVQDLTPMGGRFGLGKIVAQADIHADDWFLPCHFVGDPVMPGTLMYACCLHTLRIFLLNMGWVDAASQAHWDPVPGVASSLKCRGQVLPSTQSVTYEVEIKELGYRSFENGSFEESKNSDDGVPYAIADARMLADGKAIVEIKNMSTKLTGSSKKRIAGLWQFLNTKASASSPQTAAPATVATATAAAQDSTLPHASYSRAQLEAFACGNPSECFGPRFKVFDHPSDGGEGAFCARIPAPPFQMVDKITQIQGTPFVAKSGAAMRGHHHVAGNNWLVQSQNQRDLGLVQLLEISLQPCGVLASYMGSQLLSPKPLHFRNLGGTMQWHGDAHIPQEGRLLEVDVACTKAMQSADMLIQHYSFDMSCQGAKICSGTTYFGYFPPEALKNQVGIAQTSWIAPQTLEHAKQLVAQGAGDLIPQHPSMPQQTLQVLEKVQRSPQGGSHNLGELWGYKRIDISDWFFAAHFYQDPVMPGSLGIEALHQLLKIEVLSDVQGGLQAKRSKQLRFFVPTDAPTLRWTYRGQIIPTTGAMQVWLEVTRKQGSLAKDSSGVLEGRGFVAADGKIIYTAEALTLAWHDLA